MLYYSDMGSMPRCEQYAEGRGGSYVQTYFNITNFPIVIPLSFCLPKECNDTAYFKNFTAKLEAMIGTALNMVKKRVDIDSLYPKLAA